MSEVILKVASNSRWKLSKKLGNEYYKRVLQNKDVTWSTLSRALEGAETFFLDKNVCSLQAMEQSRATYMFCRIKIKNRTYYALKQKAANGKWGDIEFGTQIGFCPVELKK